jgi:hypothetical protein
LFGVSNRDKFRGMIADLLSEGNLLNYQGGDSSSNRWLIGFEEDKVIVLLEADDYDPFMNLEKLYSVVKRKGYARKAMSLIVNSADKWGVDIELDVAPFNYSLIDGKRDSDEIMDVNSLERFYGNYGFEKNNFDGIIYLHRISRRNKA